MLCKNPEQDRWRKLEKKFQVTVNQSNRFQRNKTKILEEIQNLGKG